VNADNFDPAELPHGHRSEALPSFALAVAPILIVFVVNLLMSLFVLPRMYTGFLAEPRFGETSLSAVSGAWSVVTALAIASLALAVIHHRSLPELRKTLDTGANASVLLVLNTASMRGYRLNRLLTTCWLSENTNCAFHNGPDSAAQARVPDSRGCFRSWGCYDASHDLG